MLLEKLNWGVLRVLTPLGPRYVNPSFAQRLYLLWLFRNFDVLPVKVLSRRQQKRIDHICAMHGFVSPIQRGDFSETPVIGTLEQRPPMEPPSQPSRRRGEVSSAVPFAADLQQRS